MSLGASNAINFYLQLDDNITPTLSRVEKGYTKVINVIDNMNRTAQRKASGAISSLEKLTQSLEALPTRMASAASKLQRTMSSSMNKVGSKTGGKASSGGDIANIVERAVERAMKRMTVRLQASIPKKPKDTSWNTKNYKDVYRQMPPPPDYSGGFHTLPGYAKGGVVKGGVSGQDSVAAMLTPGEVVLPVNLVKGLYSVFGRKPRVPHYAEGGIVSDFSDMTSAAMEMEHSMNIASVSGELLYSALTGTVDKMRAFMLPVSPLEIFSKQRIIASQPAGGVASTFALESVMESSNKYLSNIAGGMLGLRGISAVFSTVTGTLTNINKTLGSAFGIFSKIRNFLGIKEQESLLPGAAKGLLAMSTAAAAYIERDWARVRAAVSTVPGVFESVKEEGIKTMVKFGVATDVMMSRVTKFADEQKLSGKELEKTMDLVAEFSIDNEALADRTADLTWKFKKLGITIDRQRNVFSGFIEVGRETTLTLDDIASGTEQVQDAMLQLTVQGRNVDSALVGIASIAGTFKNNMVDAGSVFELFNTVIDPTRIADTAGLLNVMAIQSGKTADNMRNLLTSGNPADQMEFFETLVRTIDSVDVSKFGEMEALLAQVGSAGIDKNFVNSIKLMSQRKGITNFAEEMRSVAQSSIQQAVAGKALSERWDEYAGSIGVAWQKVKNAFYAFFMQMGEPLLQLLSPFVRVITTALQSVALFVNALGYPFRVLLVGVTALIAVAGPLGTVVGTLFLLQRSVALLGPAMSYVGMLMPRLLSGIGTFSLGLLDKLNYVNAGLSKIGISANIPIDILKKNLGNMTIGFSKWLTLLKTNPIKAISDAVRYMTFTFVKQIAVQIKETALFIKDTVVKLANVAATFLLARANMASARASAKASVAALAQSKYLGFVANNTFLAAGATKGLTAATAVWNVLVGTGAVLAAKVLAIMAAIGVVVLPIIDMLTTGGAYMSSFFVKSSDAFFNVYKWLEGIEAKLLGWGDVGAVLAWFVGQLKVATHWLSGFFSSAFEYMGYFKTAFNDAFGDFGFYVTTAFKDLIGSLKEAFGLTGEVGDAVQLSGDNFSWVRDVLVDFGTVLGYVAKGLAALLTAGVYVVSGLIKVFSFLYKAITNPFELVYPFVGKIRNWIIQTLLSIGNSLSNAGLAMSGSRVKAVNLAGASLQGVGAAIVEATPAVEVPGFQKGATIRGTDDGTIVRVGENNTTEAILPLDKLHEFGIGGNENIESLLAQIRDLLLMNARRSNAGRADPIAMSLVQNYRAGV